MEIKIEGLKELSDKLTDVGKRQLRFAISQGMNDTVYGAADAAKREIQDSFDRPTPQVVNSVVYEKADKTRLTAAVKIKDRPFNFARMLVPHIFGGGRVIKASERRLHRMGVMRKDQYITPGPGVDLDRFGNVSSGTMTRILSAAQAFWEAGYSANQTAASRKRNKAAARGVYVVPFVGIFQHTQQFYAGSGTRYTGSGTPLLFFTNKKPQYEKRFDFYFVVGEYIKRHISTNFKKAFEYAMRTSRSGN